MHAPRGPQYRAERRTEQRGTSAAARRSAALNDHPNQSEFGAADYVDDVGRQYRIAHLHRLGGWTPGVPVTPRPHDAPALTNARGHIKLWVKLKRGRAHVWPPLHAPQHKPLLLRPVAPGLSEQRVRVSALHVTRPGQRTGAVFVADLLFAPPTNDKE